MHLKPTIMLNGAGVRTILTVIYIAVFSVISPLGIAIGIGLVGTASDEYQGPAVTVLQGLATGTLIYVVFFEVLEKERAKGTNGIWQVQFFNREKITDVTFFQRIEHASIRNFSRFFSRMGSKSFISEQFVAGDF